ncbi:Sodium/hydrogen exchanger family-domain-containing protein [Epithele typhae]|uniref:Sodium/hydrogen exchanger family-domain-containing protein n=1 Tax=Epithele typhae TaxID=378194 RepID=UPI0020086D58|nr:Sodium/hydrogen exchanger family-domain-containing protein [Epithele typhae]KAH9924662.1 Sodium/hydrogen exchanger family-domain-containing protein [Epithele typhae]
MRFHPFEVSTPHVVYAALGGFVVLFGMFSLFIREKLYIGEAIWAFLFGVVIGPYGANIFDPRAWSGGNVEVSNTITLEVTRVILAIGVFAIGVELPKAYMQRHWKSLLFLLGPVMTWGWFVSGGLIYALIPGLNFLSSSSLLHASRPRTLSSQQQSLEAKSGCNDGAAFPFLYIALYLTIDSSTRQAITDWFLILWLYEVIVGCTFGALLGFGFRHLMKFCERKDLIDRQSYVAQYVSLAMLTIGATTLLGSDDLLAAFCCGTAFAWDGFFNKQTEESVFSSVIDLLFNVAAFVFVGAWMPFNDFANAELTLSVWRLLVIGILTMILRRLPIVIALYRWIPDIKTFREAIFSGHFGPMGIGAIFISTLAAQELPEAESPPQGQQQMLAATIQPIVAFMVLISIAVHGLSIPFFTFGRRVHSVSRTWSRHDTAGTLGSRRRSVLPEWATQITHVREGEAIVINRDQDQQESLTPAGSQVEKGTSSSPAASEDLTERGEARARAQTPPDGEEKVLEWNEGPHRVIERRAGPGAEVEVEVQRNVNGGEPVVEITRVAEDGAAKFLADVRERLRHAPADVEHAVEHAVDAATRVVSPTHSARSPPPPPGDEDDEGWMSDQSASGAPPRASPKDSSSRSKSPKGHAKPKGAKQKSIVAGLGTRKPRRRSVIGARPTSHHELRPTTHHEPPSRKGTWTGTGTTTGTSSPEQLPSGARTPAEDDARGRSAATRDGSGTATPRHLKLAHRRIDSIRSQAPSREMSPARSVRFADEGSGYGGGGSGTTTPKLVSPMSPASGTFSAAGADRDSPGEGGDEDSPRDRVRFSLPSPPSEHRHA